MLERLPLILSTGFAIRLDFPVCLLLAKVLLQNTLDQGTAGHLAAWGMEETCPCSGCLLFYLVWASC